MVPGKMVAMSPDHPATPSGRVHVVSFSGGWTERDDVVSVEEPLEIRLNGKAVSITMRTPGADAQLAAGFLHGEGLVKSVGDFLEVAPQLGAGAANVVELSTAEPVDEARLERHFYATSSCGVCGKSSLKALATLATPVVSDLRVPAGVILGLPERLEAAQATFARTGSLHATMLCEVDGTPICVYEDVGRHNAVDKAIGECLLAGRLPLGDALMLVSGRTSFEIVQKAVMARIPVVAAVSGPSSLAVDLAQRFGVTLIGFLRGSRFNVYSHPERVMGGAS